ncbi:MAG: hypothetical protein RRY47_04980 [Oscillospiraceae bacterium]
MKHKKLLIVLCTVLVLALGVGIGAYAASNFGSQSDPLVAKSYLTDTLTPQLQASFATKLDQQVQQLEAEIQNAGGAAAGNFKTVSLSAGQTLKCGLGSEIVLSSGSVSSAGSAGLSDLTDGVALAVGKSVVANHLCVAIGEGDGVKASSSATVLVRGAYKIA